MASAALLSSCVANPGPPPTVEPEAPPTSATEPSSEETGEDTSTSPTTTTSNAAARSTVAVGIDPLRNGLNPHLLADTSSVVDDLADLVLPSAFVDGELNSDLLVTAEEVELGSTGSVGTPATTTESVTEPTEIPDTAAETTVSSTAGAPSESTADGVVQTVRYQINPAAQWSDGTPITGADFIYLWEAMSTTPGAINSAPYRAIAEIRSTDGGRMVEVDFDARVDNWQGLFEHLLPSHLADPGGGDFATAFFDDLPASGGRFMMNTVDRARGIITLHRNDRYWGENPANFDVLTMHYVNSVTQGIDLLRSGQVSYLDRSPAETSRQAYELLPGTQTRMVDGPRQLQLDLNTESPVLGEHSARAEFKRLINVPLIARQAAGRSADIRIPEGAPAPVADAVPELLPAATEEEPLRIAADPADAAASAAVRTIADLFAGYGIEIEIVSTDIPSAASSGLPAGDIDAMVTRTRPDGSRADLASRYLCPAEPDAPRYTNISGYCTPESDALAADILSGAVDLATAQARIDALNDREHLTIPLLGERRFAVLGEGIVGPDEDFGVWEDGLSTAASWRLEEE